MLSNLNPSYAHRWVNCGASVRLLSQTIPQHDRKYANEGIEAENVAYNMLAGRPLDCTDSDMIDGAQLFCETVFNVTSDLNKVIIQGKITAPNIGPNVVGSPDAYVFLKDKNEIHIFDYKYGHAYVDAFENWQLITYASGVLSNTNHADDVKITLWIIQPRNYNFAGPVRSWVVSKAELAPYFERLKTAAAIANAPDAPYVTGSHCFRCHAAHCCDALLKVGLNALDLTNDNFFDLQGVEIGFMLALITEGIERLKALQMGLTEDISYRIRSGSQVNGYTLTPSYTNKRWSKSENELLAIASLYGINLTSTKLITPSQAEKLGFPTEGFCKRDLKTPELVSTKKLLSKIVLDNNLPF